MLFIRLSSQRRAVFLATFLAIIHLDRFKLDLLMVVDVISIFFIGILYTYLVLKTGSLFQGIILHYTQDFFIYLVQNIPRGDKTLASSLLFAAGGE